MRKLICAALLCAAGSVVAQSQVLVARQGSDSVRIMRSPCHAEVVAVDPNAESMQMALAVIDGKSYKACWELRGHMVFLRYEDGDAGAVPAGNFAQDHGA